MTAQPVSPATPVGSIPTKLPQVVIEETRFEGNEVSQTLMTLAGTSKMTPQAGDHADTVLAVGDVVTVQFDVKVTGISYDVDKNGLLTRVQRVRPIEGVAQVMDVLRARDTKIR